jgi:signal transduction histidine kinase
MWFRRRFRPPPADPPIGGEASGLGILRYFERAIGGLQTSDELQAALARFKIAPPTKQDRDLPALYLLVEGELAAAAEAPARTRKELRRTVTKHFPALAARADFTLISASSGLQERLLCQALLAAAIAHASTLLGAAGHDFLPSLAAWVDAVPSVSLPVPFVLRATIPVHDSEWVALFFRLARALYLHLEKKLGGSCARSFFERGYDDVARRYALLDTFPVVVHLLPERLLDSEKLGRLSRGQIQNVLLQKVGELNDINGQLEARCRELDATRHELVSARDDLEQRVEERTAALRVAVDELRAAKERAELADRTKSEFLANMSHELRTPLNAILGFAEVLRDAIMGPLDTRYRSYAADIHGSGQHLLDVINDILDLSKIEVGRLELREDSVALRDIADACRRVIEAKAATAGVALVFTVADDLPLIDADTTRLKQVLLNLLSNAIKFTPSGGCVTISAWAEASGLVIAVADTGIGMRAQDIPIALEPFRQIDAVLNRRYEGTGLGLPLAKRLIELHGGTIEIDSAPGRGTTVRVRLPALRIIGTVAA